ncbi:Dehydrogenase/reductase SDR family member on chromosome X [Seminavis robusta]|uniref:Dehydrogenase/reductase SDR family member on chromosome X n=1 Tax=Seminavis robusta TaxID=568900 RepID=A0A9N8H8J2_9STRA|nr:Dehydrogenase/reductase SDR family member on chromosome X [Seminavis robusta]|eukprot:Sro162_g072690.1 Dehydrogenase/reductase SDR family member on chromosome X (345) ;mRNA; f:6188-7222
MTDNGQAAAIGIGVATLVVGTAAYVFAKRPETPDNNNIRDLEGKTVCITGGNVGIGRATAEALSKRGASKILIGCRNVASARDGICQDIDRCDAFALDLSDPLSINSFAESIANHTSRSGLHMLINNAGAMIAEHDKQTTDGWDRSIAVNHLGWVALTQKLLPLLEKTAENATNNQTVRIINVGSKLERRAVLPQDKNSAPAWDEWMQSSPVPYKVFPAYAKAKFAMTSMTFLWAKQFEEQPDNRIKMIMVSPGVVHTSLSRFMPLWQRILSWPIRRFVMRTPQKGAETVIYAATSPDAVSGAYYSDCADIRNKELCSEASMSPEIGQQIWEATMRALDKRKQD